MCNSFFNIIIYFNTNCIPFFGILTIWFTICWLFGPNTLNIIKLNKSKWIHLNIKQIKNLENLNIVKTHTLYSMVCHLLIIPFGKVKAKGISFVQVGCLGHCVGSKVKATTQIKLTYIINWLV